MAKRNAATAPPTINHAGIDSLGSQRPCVKNQPISMMTDTAQSRPIVVLLYPNSSQYSEKNTYIAICESTCSAMLTNIQATCGCLSTGHTGGAASCAVASRISGTCQQLITSITKVSMHSSGKWRMPNTSNHAPAASTVSIKPSEPNSRTRPCSLTLNTPFCVTTCDSADSLIGINALLFRYIKSKQAISHSAPPPGQKNPSDPNNARHDEIRSKCACRPV